MTHREKQFVHVFVLVLVACATLFVLLRFIEEYYRDQIWLATEISLPTTRLRAELVDIEKWNVYTDKVHEFSFKYPRNYFVAELSNETIVSESEDYASDEKGMIVSVQPVDDISRNVGGVSSVIKAKLNLQNLKGRIITYFVGNPPWGYYTVSLENPEKKNAGVRFEARIHNTDSTLYSGAARDLQTFKAMLSSLRFGSEIESASTTPAAAGEEMTDINPAPEGN